MTVTRPASYKFSLEGEASGSEGGEAMFEGRVVVRERAGGFRFVPMTMATGALTGEVTVPVSSSDQEVYFIVASVPNTFTTMQTYGYQVNIAEV